MEIIKVTDLYNHVQATAKKNQAGYGSDVEFNQVLKSIDVGLLDYFHRLDEKNMNIIDHLLPFRERVKLAVVDGVADFPDKYAHLSSMGNVYVSNQCDGKEVDVTMEPVRFLRNQEVRIIRSSAVAGPNIKKKRIYAEYIKQKIYVYPPEVKEIEFDYLRYPVPGSILFDVTEVSGETVFSVNAAGTKDLEWTMNTYEYFYYYLLLNKGVETREPILMQVALPKISEILKPVT